MAYDPEAEAKKLAKKAAKRYSDQAKALEGQIKAQAKAINTTFKQALTSRMANIAATLKAGDTDLMASYKERTESLDKSASDSSKASGDQTQQNLTNRGRERIAALKQAVMHGAGESDVLQASQMSLKNWSANQSDVNRSLFDSMRSVNQSQTDLDRDTKAARLSTLFKAEGDRDAAYTEFSNRMSEAYSNLGNIRQQQAELAGLAYEQDDRSKYKKRRKGYEKAGATYFDRSADWAGKVRPSNEKAIKKLQDWKGRGDREAQNNTTEFRGNTATAIGQQSKKPEGATLRKWDT